MLFSFLSLLFCIFLHPQGLLPIVQSTVTDILGLNGCSGRWRGRQGNKWAVRKKKDHVDAVLTEELREEEVDWVTYDADELQVNIAHCVW